MLGEGALQAPHKLAVRVYYEDTDFSGVVYHASYLRFMERGRTEYLRDLGMDQRALFAATPPIGFAVAHMNIAFLKPAKMDDQLVVETLQGKVGGASLFLHQCVTRDGERLVEATVRIACVSAGKAVRLPAAIRVLFSG